MMRAGLLVLAMALSGCVSDGTISDGAGDLSVVGSGGDGTLAGPGEVRRVCGRVRGTEVETAPDTGRTRWRIIDTAPGSTAARPQYITGFDDGCARQVNAALVVFGTPAVHETVRYAAGNGAAYSEIDTAYERIKGRVCGVGARTPCPAGRMDRLTRRAAFVTIYPVFGGPAEVELLLDQGDLVAASR
ncbi:hypothetical protein [Palleronia sp. LCG004]|uniref:hypothetical protein n=1 Tax=Palleronia sp. LCG004 TaxID=3079304 RepID=UPI0029426D57|nr:hypothetical protein [Palleronia sp. LCG004]WOI55511.1 hypothetical protein RVY76_10705 [Palleronia sp. LCG004]